MRHQPSVPPPHLLLQLSLLKSKRQKVLKGRKQSTNLYQLPMVHRKNIFEIRPHRSFVVLTRHLTSIFSGYKANTFSPFVKTCCHGSNTSTEQWAEWKVAVNVCVGARSCHAGGSPWMDCIVVQKKKKKAIMETLNRFPNRVARILYHNPLIHIQSVVTEFKDKTLGAHIPMGYLSMDINIILQWHTDV